MTEHQGAPTELKPAFQSHLSGTEAIRGTLCVLIVCYHTYLYTGPLGPPSKGDFYIWVVTRWQLGLSVFFILSAFLLYRPFVQSILLGRPRPAFGAYLANRVFRIFPAYWVILIATAIFGVTVVWVPTHDYAFHLPTFLANMGLLSNLHPSGIQTGIPPAWSLAVEWVYYLILPLLVMLALRIGGRANTVGRRRFAVLVPAALLLIIGIAGRELARRTVVPEDVHGVLNTWHAVVERNFVNWSDLFAMGMIIAVARVELEAGRLRLPWWWRRAALAGWAGISSGLVWANATGRLDFHQYNLLIGPALALFICAVVLFQGDQRRDPLMRILNFRPFVVLGEMSLSVYLIHYPVIVFLVGKGIYQPGWDGMAFNMAFVSAIVFPLAYLSFRYVERPAITHKFRTKVPGPPPLEVPGAPAPRPEPARA